MENGKGYCLQKKTNECSMCRKDLRMDFWLYPKQLNLLINARIFYEPQDEGGILYNDPTLKIEWPLHLVDEVLLSEKDRRLATFDQYHQQE